MEILVNEHVCDTKLNVLNTYLKAMFNLGNTSESLSVKDLVPDQNPKTTSAHIKKAMDAGYAYRWANCIKIGENEFRSYPNEYYAVNPTHILYVEKIDKATAYKVQKFFGKVNASRNTIEACKGVLDSSEIKIEEMTKNDYEDKRDCYLQILTINGTRYIT